MAVMIRARPRDKDYLQTQEGLYFCVYSHLHGPDRITAYLQYLPGGPDPRRNRVKPMDFPHVGAVVDVMGWLHKHHPIYLGECPIRRLLLPLVPVQRVVRYFRPEERLQEILSRPKDELEELAADFARTVAASAGVPLSDLGVTGSILLDVHDPATSDIDLTVYGRTAAQRVRRAFRDGRVPHVTPMPPLRKERWLRLMSDHHPHTREEAAYLISRRWNYGFYRRREFGVKPVLREDEVTESLPAMPYRHGELVRLQATVADAADSLFQPAVYGLTEMRLLEGDAVPVRQVASFEWLYAGAFDAGQQVEVCGRWEETAPGDYRLVVGSARFRGREYIRCIADPDEEDAR